MTGARPRWNRGGRVRTDTYLGVIPLRVFVGGRDAPLAARGRAVWYAVMTLLIVTSVGVVAVLALR